MGRAGGSRSNLCIGHKTVLQARAKGLLAARWGINTRRRSKNGMRGLGQLRDVAEGKGASRGCKLIRNRVKRATEAAKQQPHGIRKPVAMER